jgi:ABC-type sugar transport system ATPase subunit
MRGPRIEKGFGAASAARVWPTVGPAPSVRFYRRDVRRSERPALVCSGISRPTEFEDISFEPHKDEILLFYGLVGTGRSPVLPAPTGVTRPSRSAVTLAAKTMTPNPSLSTSMIALTIGVRMGLARSVGAWSGSSASRLWS